MKNNTHEKNMKDRILFWVDVSLIQFGVAKILQEKIDSDFYVIYDLNHHLKKSFMQQNLVNFKKEWYFWDNIGKTKEPNIDALVPMLCFGYSAEPKPKQPAQRLPALVSLVCLTVLGGPA